MAVSLHRLTGLALLLFIASHLAVHLVALHSPEAHGAALAVVRKAYRPMLVEPLLIAAFAVQIGIGLRLAWGRWRAGVGGAMARWQLASGLYLALFLVNHVGAALATRYAFGLDTNFHWAAATLLHPVTRWTFYPYYAAAVMALFVHLAAALHFHGSSLAVVRLVVTGGMMVTAAILLAFGGWLYPLALPPANRAYLDGLLAMFGL